MAIYKCNECGMSVNTSCGECNEPLEDGFLNLDDGSKVQISQCNKMIAQTIMVKLNLHCVVAMI